MESVLASAKPTLHKERLSGLDSLSFIESKIGLITILG